MRFIVAVPVVDAVGSIGMGVLGVQSGINVAGTLVYFTSLRANGSRCELGVGRIGSIIGPLLGSLFVMLPVRSSATRSTA